MTDKKEYIHHRAYYPSYPYIHCKTINKTTTKNGLGAIKPRQRPNRSPTNYLYTKPSNQSTYSPSIDPSIQPSVHSCAAVCIHHASESNTCFRQSGECLRRQPQKHSKSRKVIVNSHDRYERIHPSYYPSHLYIHTLQNNKQNYH